jgi:hypothetical protein
VGGLSSANWIIERIETFAKSIGEPFSAEEISMLRKSIEFFNEKNRTEFAKVNAKTVQMIRETIIDEKLAGADCVEARDGLYIPNQWKSNYLEVYNSEISWLISHCVQSAMLHDPTMGESKNWESAKVLTGTRKPALKNSEQKEVISVPSNIEFDLLATSIQAFLSTTDFLFRVNSELAQSFQRELPDEESNQFRTRLELLNILNSIGDIDDDATSAWSLFVLDEQIHEAEKANRNLLREKSKFGTNTVFSRTELKSRGLLEEGFSRKSSPFFIDVVATFDLICKTVGIEPIFAKLYANAMTQLALAIAKSSVFSVDKTRSMNEVYRFASVLAQQVEVLDAFDPNSGSIEELRSNYLAITFKESGIVDLLSIMNWEAEINEDYLDEWTEKFGAMLEGFLIKSEATSDERIEMEDEHALEFDHVEDENVRDAAVRLIEVEELFRKGLLTDDEYAVKRKQIIDQI